MNWSKFIKRLLKIITHFIVDAVIILFLVFGVFYFFEDEIKNELLSVVNNYQNGEIEIAEIDLSIFKYFPLISLQLSDVNYYENKSWLGTESSAMICQSKNIYISVNIIDLIQGSINVRKLTIDEGKFNFTVYADSSINLINALGFETNAKDTTESDIIIENVTINGMIFNYNNEVSQHKAILNLQNLTNQFIFRQNLINCKLEFSGLLKLLSLEDRFRITDQDVSADLEFSINTDSIGGEIRDSRIQIDNFILKVDGNYGFQGAYLTQLNLELSDENIEAFSQIFSGQLIENQTDIISEGAVYGNGNLKWKSFDSLPRVDFQFGIDNLNLIHPKDTSLYVFMDFDGIFSTGQASDYSELSLELSDINARLPGGNVTGSFSLIDLQNPMFDLKLDADFDISGYEKIFNFSEVDSLEGRLKVITDLKGSYSKSMNEFIFEWGNTDIQINDLTLDLKRWQQRIFKLNGRINQSAHIFRIEDLSIFSTFGDMKINGEIENLFTRFFKETKSLTGNIKAESHELDLGKLIGPENSVIKVIGRKVKNIGIDLAINMAAPTNTGESRTVLNILKGEVELVEYPDVKSLTGVMDIEPGLVGFSNLQLKTDFGELIFNGDLKHDQTPYIALNSNIYLTDFYINKFASKNPDADIIRLDLSGKFDGKMSITYGKDFDLLNLKDFMIDHGGLYYLNKTDSDTVEITGLKANLESAAINVSDGDEILPTLDVTGSYKSKRLKVNNFKYNNLSTEISGKSGKIRLSKNHMDLFGIYGNLIADADFTSDDYIYRIEHTANGQNIEHILDSITENDLIDGLLDISFWLQMSGNTLKENLQSMQGQIHNRGKNLLVKRIDLDELVKRFEKTQNFRLLDVGAFVFAGPAGAVLTKSVDYANLLNLNTGDSTLINDFISEIEIKDGIAIIEDMAFSTQKNRITFDGSIDLRNQAFIDFVIAIVNKDGCIIISQKLNGPFAEPVLEEFSTISTVLAPIRNAYNSVVGNECTPFYTGEIAHPN